MTLDERLAAYAVRAFRAYLASEARLSVAVSAGDKGAVESAELDTMLAGRSAAIELHQFGDAVAVDHPDWLPREVTSVGAVREWVEARFCRMLREAPCSDLSVLRDVADAFKHVELTRRSALHVASDQATIGMQTGYGRLAWGEGKFGGVHQVVITLSDDTQRALSSVLQNALDAWRLALGLPLPDFGE